MTARRLPFARAASALAVLLVLGAPQARAGMFDDDEARRQIKDLTLQLNERLDTVSKGQFELLNQIQAMQEENARLRGRVETLEYELDSAKKRQQDFYIDLDGRLRKLEPQVAAPEDGKPAGEAAAAPKKADPAVEARDYEAALNLFKANKVKDAAQALDAFVKTYPDSSLTPNAQYWLGNAHYSLRDCKKAIEVQRVVVAKWPQHPTAPDALANIVTCQQELGDAKGAKATTDTLLAKYPDSPAAQAAKKRQKK